MSARNSTGKMFNFLALKLIGISFSLLVGYCVECESKFNKNLETCAMSNAIVHTIHISWESIQSTVQNCTQTSRNRTETPKRDKQNKIRNLCNAQTLSRGKNNKKSRTKRSATQMKWENCSISPSFNFKHL